MKTVAEGGVHPVQVQARSTRLEIRMAEARRAQERRNWLDKNIGNNGAPATTAATNTVQNGDQALDIDPDAGPTVPDRPPDFVGLALSGGGIRSATFSAGILSSLSRLGLIHRVDYFSTVLGGSKKIIRRS